MLNVLIEKIGNKLQSRLILPEETFDETQSTFTVILAMQPPVKAIFTLPYDEAWDIAQDEDTLHKLVISATDTAQGDEQWYKIVFVYDQPDGLKRFHSLANRVKTRLNQHLANGAGWMNPQFVIVGQPPAVVIDLAISDRALTAMHDVTKRLAKQLKAHGVLMSETEFNERYEGLQS